MTAPALPTRPSAAPLDSLGFQITADSGPTAIIYHPDVAPGSELAAALAGAGYRVRRVGSPGELLGELRPARASSDRPAFLVVSVAPTETDVLDVLGAIDHSFGLPPCVALVPDGCDDLRAAAFECGVTTVVEGHYSARTVLAIAAEEVPAEPVIAC